MKLSDETKIEMMSNAYEVFKVWMDQPTQPNYDIVSNYMASINWYFESLVPNNIGVPV